MPEFVGQLTNLTSLNLNDNQLEDVPESIGQLTNLTSLYLSSNPLRRVPESIGQLTNLTEFNLSNNQLKEVPEFVGQLTNLTSLDLSSNQLQKVPESIGQLTNLTSLNLNDNQLEDVPESIGQLTNLTSLYLSSNPLRRVPESIGQLTNLTEFNLSNNQLTEVPEFIGQLTNLSFLNLNKNQFTEVPESIGQLTNLNLLILSRNQLKDLPEYVGQLTSLTGLHLGSNRFSEMPESIGQLTSLTSLDLSLNKIKEVPEVVTRLPALTTLSLWNNKISQLPIWISQLTKLERLDLRANQLPIPPEILGGKSQYFDKPSPIAEVINYYFQEKSDAPLYESKLLIVGEGGAGKTTLAKKLQNADYQLQENEESTEGIDVLPYSFDHPDGHPCKVNIWDFGGQEIYHATHQFFLTERAVYALVTDSRQGNTDFYFWLNVIQLHGADSPVILIKNEKNDRPCPVPDLQLRGQFSNLKESIEVNLADNRNLEVVQAKLHHYIATLPHVGDNLPKTWAKVRSVLENQSLGSDNYIYIQDYRQICIDQGISDRAEQNSLSRFLHNLGVFLHFQDIDQLAKTIFLTPVWSTDAVYKVLDTPKVRKDCGRFNRDDLKEIWKDNQYADVRGELLALMKEFEVCYEIPGREHHYIAPHLLEANLSEEHQTYKDTWDTTDNLILTYHYPFKPKNIFPRFIVALHRYIEKQRLVWKHGVILIIGSSRAEVIEDAHYNNANICIRVSGTDKRRALSIIGHELERIHASFEKLNYQTLIPCNCSECKISQDPFQFPYDVLQKSLERRNFEVQCYKSFEFVNVRNLIDDVIEPQADTGRIFDESRYRARGKAGDPLSKRITSPSSTKSPFSDQRVEVNINFAEQQYQETNTIEVGGDVTDAQLTAGKNNTSTQSSQTVQHSKGDNIAGDKVLGDSIQTQINNNPDLAQTAGDIKSLLNELSEEYNPNSAKGQAKIETAALAEIKQNPTLKQRTIKALQSAGDEALEQAIQHPVAKVVVEGIKGFLQS